MKGSKLRGAGVALAAWSCGGCAAVGSATDSLGSVFNLALALVAMALPFALGYYAWTKQ